MKIQKKDLEGGIAFEYEGKALRRGENFIIVEALFGRDDMAFLNVILKKGDRFVETFYSDKWFNIFEIYDRDDGKLKGWYCNIGKPAIIEADAVSYVDLALDLWVAPDGTQTVLDEDEFLELNLDSELTEKAYEGLSELRALLKTKNPHL